MRNFISKFFGGGRTALAAAVLMLGVGATAQTASAGTVILEGSDAIGYHCAGYGQSAACDYMNQTWTALGGSSSLPVAVVGTTAGGPVTSSTHAIVTMTNLSTAGALSDYAAIYLLAGGGCCDSSPADMAGREADVLAYVLAGGTVEIGDYDGNAGFDFLTGGSGNAAHVAGIGGALSGPGCSDLETVNALGLSNGFTQPAPVGCWTHQGYDQPYFAGLGFTLSFFDADPAFAALNSGFGPFSSLLSNGLTITGVDNGPAGVPEPLTLSLFGAGLAGAVVIRRRKSKKA